MHIYVHDSSCGKPFWLIQHPISSCPFLAGFYYDVYTSEVFVSEHPLQIGAGSGHVTQIWPMKHRSLLHHLLLLPFLHAFTTYLHKAAAPSYHHEGKAKRTPVMSPLTTLSC